MRHRLEYEVSLPSAGRVLGVFREARDALACAASYRQMSGRDAIVRAVARELVQEPPPDCQIDLLTDEVTEEPPPDDDDDGDELDFREPPPADGDDLCHGPDGDEDESRAKRRLTGNLERN